MERTRPTLSFMSAAAKLVFVVFCAAVAFGQNSIDLNSSVSLGSGEKSTDLTVLRDEARFFPHLSAEITNPTPVVVMGSKADAKIPERPIVSKREREIWYALVFTDHGAAAFDAWSTRQVLSTGGRELDPLVRPFAHSPALYPALQVAPLGVDYFTMRLMHSRNRTLRKLWWVPQGVTAAGSLVCGTMNLSNRR